MLLSAFGVAAGAAAALCLLAFAGLSYATFGIGMALYMAGIAVFCGALTVYVARDAIGKRPWRIEVTASEARLDLPAYRSLVHRPPAFRGTIPFAEIVAVETRLEAYRGVMGGMMQRAYRLVRKDGPAIFLFEERALGTRMATGSLKGVAAELAGRAGAPLKDLGMVEAGSGLLGAAFVHAPDWSAPSVDARRQARDWRGVQLTGLVALVATALVLLLLWLR